MMTLPPPLQTAFETKLDDYEKELNMPFLSTIEENAQAKGKEIGKEIGKELGKEIGAIKNCQENIIKILSSRFANLPQKMIHTIKGIDNMSILENLLLPSINVNSVEEFQQLIDSYLPQN
jgi:predicted transposase YdaD